MTYETHDGFDVEGTDLVWILVVDPDTQDRVYDIEEVYAESVFDVSQTFKDKQSAIEFAIEEIESNIEHHTYLAEANREALANFQKMAAKEKGAPVA